MTSSINHATPGNKDIPLASNSNRKSSPLKRIALGALLASTELLSFGHVLDRIKTEQQAHPKEYSAWQAARKIYTNRGILGFYTGVGWNVLTHSGKSAFRWTVMGCMDEFLTRVIPKNFNERHKNLQPTLLGLSVSVIEATCLVCPAELLKTKEMTNASKNYHFIPYMKKIGWQRLFDGLDVILFRQAVSWCSFLIAYDKSSRIANNLVGGRRLTIIEQFSVGAVAGAVNVLFTTPLDTTKTLVQKDQPIRAKHIVPAVKEIYREHGIKGFYTSLGVRMLRSTWYAGVTLLMMDRFGIFRKYHA